MWRQTLRVLPTYTGQSPFVTHAGQRTQPSLTRLQSVPEIKYLDPQQPSTAAAANHHHQQQHAGLLKEIELVPTNLRRHLFPDTLESTEDVDDGVPDEVLDRIDLPKLDPSVAEHGLMAHFDLIGRAQFDRYEKLLLAALAIGHAPPMPSEWVMTTGWTRYDPETGHAEPVSYPTEDVLFFDVEVAVLDGRLPTMAVAMAPGCWYSWCSERLAHGTEVPEFTRLEHLIPLEPTDGTSDPRIVIGHNVGFDRSRVREQYYPEKTGTRFWDTMSMSIGIFGMADHQRLVYEKSDLAEDNFNRRALWVDTWRARVCKNGLGAVHAKLCGESTKLELNKSMQEVFVKEDIGVIRENFQALMLYCAIDVQATFEIFAKLYPLFRDRFPHPITSLGMIEMASAYLPITENWRHFYERCNEDASKRNNLAARGLAEASSRLVDDLSAEASAFESDPWMWIADWKMHAKKRKPRWYLNLVTADDKPLDEIEHGDVKFRCRDVPRIFGLCYGPFPMHFKADYGWGYLVPSPERSAGCADVVKVRVKRGDVVSLPNRAIIDLVERNRASGVPEPPLPDAPDSTVGVFDFYRLPHPNSQGANVGSPFAKDFLASYDSEVIRATRFGDALRNYLLTFKETRFWGNYKDRFNEEITVWLDDGAKIGAIAPSIVPAGTITRRATHKLWLTSTSPKDGIIGTDLKSMVQSSPGWKLVGADVDSQEQWLAALLGDVGSGEGRAGVTPFSNMLLAGSKADNSDLHSIVAKQVGISRNHAKVLNYARLYGAGMAHAVEFLKKKAISEVQAKNYSEKLFTTTKGVNKMYRELNPELKAEFYEFLRTSCPLEFANQHVEQSGRIFLPVYLHVDGQQTQLFENWYTRKQNKGSLTLNDQVLFLIHMYPTYPKAVSLFKNGFESSTFNFLEMKALEDQPSTPILGCRLSQALEALPPDAPQADDFRARYKRTVINWVIQSTAVDFLHMLLVCMKWLCDEYDIKARFVLSIHDEIRYLVAEEDQYRCALALTLSNMYVRAAISQKLGISELPKSVAFFSQVDIDTVLRKEVDQPCQTPDGRVVPPGVALDMEAIVEKTSGSLLRPPAPE